MKLFASWLIIIIISAILLVLFPLYLLHLLFPVLIFIFTSVTLYTFEELIFFMHVTPTYIDQAVIFKKSNNDMDHPSVLQYVCEIDVEETNKLKNIFKYGIIISDSTITSILTYWLLNQMSYETSWITIMSFVGGYVSLSSNVHFIIGNILIKYMGKVKKDMCNKKLIKMSVSIDDFDMLADSAHSNHENKTDTGKLTEGFLTDLEIITIVPFEIEHN